MIDTVSNMFIDWYSKWRNMNMNLDMDKNRGSI